MTLGTVLATLLLLGRIVALTIFTAVFKKQLHNLKHLQVPDYAKATRNMLLGAVVVSIVAQVVPIIFDMYDIFYDVSNTHIAAYRMFNVAAAIATAAAFYALYCDIEHGNKQ